MNDTLEAKNIFDNLKTTTITLAKSIGWLGGAAGGIVILLTACGYIVNYAYLESLGVPRSSLGIKASEHVLAGGHFIISLIQFSTIGLLNLLVNAWWFILALLLSGIICWWLHAKNISRLILFSIIYVLWMFLALSKLSDTGNTNFYGVDITSAAIVMMHTAMTVIAIIYIVTEALLLGSLDKLAALKYRLASVFFGLVVLTASTMLPYLKGAYATKQVHPLIKPIVVNLNHDDKMIDNGGLDSKSDLWQRQLQIIQVGEKKIVLRDTQDQSIIIIPTETIPAYRLIPIQR